MSNQAVSDTVAYPSEMSPSDERDVIDRAIVGEDYFAVAEYWPDDNEFAIVTPTTMEDYQFLRKLDSLKSLEESLEVKLGERFEEGKTGGFKISDRYQHVSYGQGTPQVKFENIKYSLNDGTVNGVGDFSNEIVINGQLTPSNIEHSVAFLPDERAIEDFRAFLENPPTMSELLDDGNKDPGEIDYEVARRMEQELEESGS